MGNFGDGNGWFNPGLMAWAWRRHRFSLRFASLLSVAVLILLVINTRFAWVDSNGLFWWMLLWSSSAVDSGLSAVSDRLKLQKMTAFLLARPVSRRQYYNQTLLEKSAVLLLPGLAVVLYVLAAPPAGALWPDFHVSVAAPILILPAAVAPVAYLLGVWLGTFSYATGSKAVRIVASSIWGAVLGTAIWGVGRHPLITVPARLPAAAGTVLAGFGLFLAVWFYLAGRRRFSRLDLTLDTVGTVGRKRSPESNKASTGRPSPAWLRWLWTRNRQLNLLCLAVSIALLAGLVLRDMHRAAWPDNPFLIAGLWAAFLGGASAVRTGDKTAAFLLARPISRRRLYGMLVLAGLIPWLLVGALPALAAAAGSALGAADPVLFYVVYVLWTMAFYFVTIYLAAVGKTVPKKSAKIQAAAFFILIILASSTTGYWAGPPAAAFISFWGPVLLAAGLALAGLSFRAGWRLYRHLDF